ncbi:MAG: Hsp20/alpha crystallin family protein [Bacteroidia bacterium]
MNIIKANPKRTWNDGFMPSIFGQLMDDFVSDSRMATFQNFSPKTDISEDDKGYYLEIALPGMRKEDVTLEIKQDVLNIEGERQFKNEEKGKTYHRIETNYGKFKRSFTLPDPVNREGVDASFEQGVLKIFLPKTEKVAPKAIVIK